MIDRTTARQAFDEYSRDYDPANPRIALKIAHTHRVATICDAIARNEGFDPDLAWLCGLLHDIGRFEQVRRYDTFNDSISVPHADLGVAVLFDTDAHGDALLRSFLADDSYDDLLRAAIAYHSSYRLPDSLDETTQAYCHVLRDADKIDIIKVNCICPITDIYGVTENDMEISDLSTEVINTFYEHRTVPREIRRYPADILVSHICFAWELVYPTSRAILASQGHLEQMLSRRFVNPQVQHEFEQMGNHLRAWMSNHTPETTQRKAHA